MKPLLAVITLILGFVFMQAGAFAALPEAKAENPNLTAGRQAIDANDFRSALKSLTKAVQENPKDADAQTMLGYSYRKLGTFDKSMEHYQKALKIDSKHRSAHEYLGELYTKRIILVRQQSSKASLCSSHFPREYLFK